MALSNYGDVRRHPKTDDWFLIPREWLSTVGAVPQVLIYRGEIAIHRTHLPLLADKYMSAGKTLQELQAKVDLEARAKMDEETSRLGWMLRPHQHVAREFIISRRGTLLGDSMRVGKTASAISAHKRTDGPLLIVAPLSVRLVWLEWIFRLWPDATPTVLRGRKGEVLSLRDDDIVFCHYDVLTHWRHAANDCRIGTLIFDEAHLLTNRKSQRHRGALLVGARANRVVALTGTPLWNKTNGIWSILSLLNPGAWGSWFEFSERYCAGHPGTHGYIAEGHSNEQEFKDRMKEVFLRRTWMEIAENLPATERSTEIAEVSEHQSNRLDELVQEARDALTKGHSTQCGEVARLRRLLGNLKRPVTIEIALRVLEEEQHVIVWTWHRALAHQVTSDLRDNKMLSYVVSGDIAIEKREEIFRTWRSRGGALVLTLSVGQVGIDLSAARHEIFAEVDYTPSVVAQAEMRPFSPLRPMAVTYVVADHFVDKRIVEAIQRKCANGEALNLPAAEGSLKVISEAFGIEDEGDLDRLAQAILSADVEDDDDDDMSCAC